MGEPTIDNETNFELALNLYKEGKYFSVIDILKNFSSEDYSAKLINLMAMSFYNIGEATKAINLIEDALSDYPESAELRFNVARMLEGTSSLKSAAEYYKDAIKINPQYTNALNNLGAIQLKAGQIDEAIENFKIARNTTAENTHILANLGAAWANKKDYLKAINVYEYILRKDPKRVEIINSLAGCYLKIGEIDKAKILYQTALRYQPKNLNVISNLAALVVQLSGTSWEEISTIDSLVSSAPEMANKPKYLVQRAIHSYIQGNLTESALYISQLERVNPKVLSDLCAIDKKFVGAYYKFLKKLLQKRPVQSAEIYNTVHHIGESHCLSFAHRVLSIKSEQYKVYPKIIFGAKAFHFAQLGGNEYKAITIKQLNDIPAGSKLMLSFGEIDCRVDEGIIAASEKSNTVAVVNETVKGYVNWFNEQANIRRHQLYFFAVPAPKYLGNISQEINLKRAKIVKLFNSRLAEASKSHGHELLDTYSLTVGCDGFSNQKHHLDGVHLDPDCLKEIGLI